MSAQYAGPISVVRHRRPAACAVNSIVPDPANGSSTASPGAVNTVSSHDSSSGGLRDG
jgi:hypothetical protein